MRNAENSQRVKCGKFCAEKVCGMKGKMRKIFCGKNKDKPQYPIHVQAYKHVQIYVCMYACMHAYIYIHMYHCICIYMHICIIVYIYVIILDIVPLCIHLRTVYGVDACMCECVWVCMCAGVRLYIYIYIYIYKKKKNICSLS